MVYFWIITVGIFILCMIIATIKALIECWDSDPSIVFNSMSIIHPGITNFWVWGLGTFFALMFVYSFLKWILYTFGG